MNPRTFPGPWRVEATGSAFVIKDAKDFLSLTSTGSLNRRCGNSISVGAKLLWEIKARSEMAGLLLMTTC